MKIRNLTKPNLCYLCISAKFSKTLMENAFGLTILNNFENFDGFLIKNCRIIHSFFMKYSFDAVFINGENQVVAMYSDFRPFRISKFHKKAKYVLELPQGSIKKFEINLLDKLEINYS